MPPSTDAIALDRTQTLSPADQSDRPTARGSGVPADLPAPTGNVRERYDLLAEHARGGLGRVVRAHDKHLGRTVAVKELLRTNELAEALFVREALITARLEHPGIVPVHEAGRWPNGDPYYVMRLVSGRTLKEEIAATRSLSDRLAILPHVIAVAETVGYAHSQDVIHRDLKPANVILGEYGETVVIDWGLARDLRSGDATPEVEGTARGSGGGTVTGRVVGTPQYMSPEQARGESVDARADVYALGAMLYEVLSARAPVGGDSVQEIIDRVLAGPPAPLAQVVPGVPADLDAIVAKAMARNPDDRYLTARELAADLKRFQTGQLVTAQRYGRWSLFRRWVRRNRGYVAIATIGVVAVTVLAVGMFRRVIDERTLAETRGEQAELAREKAETREKQIVLAQARAALSHDPTAALAWLKRFPIDARTVRDIAALVDEAEASGVASHVWRTDEWVAGVAISNDGSKVATAVRDGKVRVYDTATGDVRVLGSRPALTAVAFDARAGHVLTADHDGQIWAWGVSDGSARQLGEHAMVEQIEPAADGRLATLSEDHSIRVWDVNSGEMVRDLFSDLPREQRSSSTWDGRRGELALTGDVDGHIRLWRDGSAREVVKLPEAVYRLAMTHDGKRAVATDASSIYLIDVEHGAVTPVGPHGGKVKRIRIDPPEQRALVASEAHDVLLVDLATGKLDSLRGHEDALYMGAFDDRGQRLVTAGDDGTARVWDLDTGDSRVLRGHTDDVYTLAMTPDGRVVATGSIDGSARLWRLGDRRTTVVGQLGDVRSTRPVGGDVIRVMSASDPQAVIDVDLRNRTTAVRHRQHSLIENPSLSTDGTSALFMSKRDEVVVWHDGQTETIRSAAHGFLGRDISDDGSRAVLLEAGGDVRLRSAGGDVQLLARCEDASGVTMTRTGDRVAVMRDRGIDVIETATGEVSRRASRERLGLPPGHKFGLRFAPDERVLLISSPGAGLRAWRLDTDQVTALGDSDYALLNYVAFSPDGTRLAAGVESRRVRVWDLDTGEAVRTLFGHRDLVMALEFAPDNSRLATGSYDRTARVWDLGSGESQVLSGHIGAVRAVAWLGNDRLVTGSSDGTVRQWDVPVSPPPTADQLVARLAGRTSAVMTFDEVRRSAFPATPVREP